MTLEIEAKGPNARFAKGAAALIAGEPENGAVDAHTIQPFFAGVVARSCGMSVALEAEGDVVRMLAKPAAAA